MALFTKSAVSSELESAQDHRRPEVGVRMRVKRQIAFLITRDPAKTLFADRYFDQSRSSSSNSNKTLDPLYQQDTKQFIHCLSLPSSPLSLPIILSRGHKYIFKVDCLDSQYNYCTPSLAFSEAGISGGGGRGMRNVTLTAS